MEAEGVSTQGDFEPVVDEAMLYRAQAVLDGRVVVSGLRGLVRCDVCGRPLTGSWSKGRNGHYAYYHCQRQCRAVNVSKAALEGAFVDELALLQPTSGYMRLVKDRILPDHPWERSPAAGIGQLGADGLPSSASAASGSLSGIRQTCGRLRW